MFVVAHTGVCVRCGAGAAAMKECEEDTDGPEIQRGFRDLVKNLRSFPDRNAVGASSKCVKVAAGIPCTLEE